MSVICVFLTMSTKVFTNNPTVLFHQIFVLQHSREKKQTGSTPDKFQCRINSCCLFFFSPLAHFLPLLLLLRDMPQRDQPFGEFGNNCPEITKWAMEERQKIISPGQWISWGATEWHTKCEMWDKSGLLSLCWLLSLRALGENSQHERNQTPTLLLLQKQSS